MSDQRDLLLVLELEPEADLDEAERLGRQLRTELIRLDVEAVKPAPIADVPEGAKGGAVGVFTSVIAMAQDWLDRHSAAQRIEMTIDDDTIVLDRASAHEREQLIGTWVRRHSVP